MQEQFERLRGIVPRNAIQPELLRDSGAVTVDQRRWITLSGPDERGEGDGKTPNYFNLSQVNVRTVCRIRPLHMTAQ